MTSQKTFSVNIDVVLTTEVWVVGWLVVLRIYVALAVYQPYRDLEAGDNKSLKFKWRGGESNEVWVVMTLQDKGAFHSWIKSFLTYKTLR